MRFQFTLTGRLCHLTDATNSDNVEIFSNCDDVRNTEFKSILQSDVKVC